MLVEGTHLRLKVGTQDYYFTLPNIASYQKADLSPFTNRSSVGSLTLTAMDHQGAVEQRTFSAGMGQVELYENTRYRYGDRIDARTPGHVTIYTNTNTITSIGITGSPSLTTGILDSGSGDVEYLILGGTGGVFVWDGASGSVTDISSGLTSTNIKEVYHNGIHLFAGVGSNNRIEQFTGDVASPAWTVVASAGDEITNAAAFCVHDGYFWCAEQDARSNLVHYASRDDFTDFEGNTQVANHPSYSATGDIDAVEVGPWGYNVKRLLSYGGVLFAFRVDGIWTIQLEGNISNPSAGSFVAKRLFDFSDDIDSTNFDMVCYHNDGMYFNVGRSIWRYAGGGPTSRGTLLNVTPGNLTVDYPPQYDAPAKCAISIHGMMYVIVGSHLYCLTANEAWHILRRGAALNTVGSAIAYFAEAETPYLCALYTTGSSTTLAYWRADDEFSRPPYDTTLSGSYLYTSLFDGGFINIPKHFAKLKIYGRIPDTGGSIAVTAYVLNEEGGIDTYELGTLSRADYAGTDEVLSPSLFSDIKARRTVTLRFPRTAQGRAVVFKFVLQMPTGADPEDSAPVLYGYLLEYVLRPETIYGFNVAVMVNDHVQTADGRTYELTGDEMREVFKDARDQIYPLEYEDFLGNTGQVYLTAIEESAATWQPPELPSGIEGVATMVRMSFLLFDAPCVETNVDSDTTVYGTYVVECTVNVNATLTIEST
jgi:hypothetical protein